MSLSLTQKAGEAIILTDENGNEVRVITSRVQGQRCTYNIEAPDNYRIRRWKPENRDQSTQRRIQRLEEELRDLKQQRVGA